MYICDKCGKQIQNHGSFLNHYKFCKGLKEEKELKFECECGKKFETKIQRGRHRIRCKVYKELHPTNNNSEKYTDRYKISDTEYQCECGKIFTKNNIFSFCGHLHNCRKHLKENNLPFPSYNKWEHYTEEEKQKDIQKAKETRKKKMDEGLYKPSFKGKHHTEKTKQKMREKRLKFMKENSEKTAWRQSNFSYPEQQFFKFLEEKEYTKKFNIQREFSVFPYYIDFAFVDIKLAIEIDGSQHLLEDRKQRDMKKDKILKENGWKVIRISEKLVRTDWNEMQNIIEKEI